MFHVSDIIDMSSQPFVTSSLETSQALINNPLRRSLVRPFMTHLRIEFRIQLNSNLSFGCSRRENLLESTTNNTKCENNDNNYSYQSRHNSVEQTFCFLPFHFRSFFSSSPNTFGEVFTQAKREVQTKAGFGSERKINPFALILTRLLVHYPRKKKLKKESWYEKLEYVHDALRCFVWILLYPFASSFPS